MTTALQVRPEKQRAPSGKVLVRAATPADIDQLATMAMLWQRDYLRAGDAANALSKEYWCTRWSQLHELQRTLIADVDGSIAGFVICKPSHGNEATIDIVFVRKAFRSKGVAKALYVAAIQNLSATSIEITYGRVLEHIAYWRSLGFRSVAPKLGQRYTKRALCYLMLADVTKGKLMISLDNASIRRFMQSMQLMVNS